VLPQKELLQHLWVKLNRAGEICSHARAGADDINAQGLTLLHRPSHALTGQLLLNTAFSALQSQIQVQIQSIETLCCCYQAGIKKAERQGTPETNPARTIGLHTAIINVC
jgi:hypothetical protein